MEKENSELLNVEAEIEVIRGQINSMGANDAEFSLLDNILENWHKKDISDTEAIEQARVVLESKQDYH